MGLVPWGTPNEDLLRWCSGRRDPLVRLHVCPEDCDGVVGSEDLVRATKVRKFKVADKGAWCDELEELRKKAEKMEA